MFHVVSWGDRATEAQLKETEGNNQVHKNTWLSSPALADLVPNLVRSAPLGVGWRQLLVDLILNRRNLGLPPIRVTRADIDFLRDLCRHHALRLRMS
jgi:hypothetical protein